jgi:hypothetical protein
MKLLFLGLLSLVLFSCVYNVKKESLPAPIITQEITYTNYVKNVISESGCLNCHSGAFPAANRDYTTYTGLMQSVNDGNFKKRVIDGVQPTMPLGSPELNQTTKDSLTTWINQGAKE